MIEFKKRRMKRMFIDIIPSAKDIIESKLIHKNAVVIDVLRATSVIVTALYHGAKAIIPVREVEEAFFIYQKGSTDEYRLSGERKGLPIPGFHFGNSPLEYTKKAVENKTLILTTTNGTQGIKGAEKSDTLYIGSFLNGKAVANQLLEEEKDVVLVCAGTNGIFSLEDGLCAGKIISSLNQSTSIKTTDFGVALQALYEGHKNSLLPFIQQGAHCRYLIEQGFQSDILYCIQEDLYDRIPVYKNNKIILP